MQVKVMKYALFLALLVLLSACGGGDTPTQAPVLVATAQFPADSGVGHPHVYASMLEPTHAVRYSAGSEEDKIVARWGDAGESAILQLNGFYPDALFLPDGLPGVVWVAGHHADGRFAVRAYTDTSGDGVIDVSSAEELISGDRPDRVGGLVFDSTSGTLFIRETVTDHIFKAHDTTGDGRPNDLLGMPFVDGAWPGPPGSEFGEDPVYATVEDLVTGEEVTVPAGYMKLATGLTGAGVDRVRVSNIAQWLIDSDGDNVVDTVEDIVEVAAPSLGTSLVDGVRRVQLFGADGATLEFRDEFGTSLGQGASGDWIVLGNPVVAGQRFRVVDVTNQLMTDLLAVGARRIYAHEPGVVTDGSAQTVTITGANLDLVTQVILERSDASVVLTYQSISPWQIDVNLPAMGEAWDERTEMVLIPSGAFDIDDPDTYEDRVGVERCPHEE